MRARAHTDDHTRTHHKKMQNTKQSMRSIDTYFVRIKWPALVRALKSANLSEPKSLCHLFDAAYHPGKEVATKAAFQHLPEEVSEFEFMLVTW